MSQESLAALITLLAICAISLLIAGVTKYRPPHAINLLYGYRTGRSMRTPATWQEANRYFAEYFWRLSCGLPALALGAFLLMRDGWAVALVLGGWILGLGIGVWQTERRLQRRFDEQGQPRT
ncbi:SdpI family protein [Hymenobacter sp. B81]|uniref:SdpI family protein n=1 Tax=Hymenobacter sp. B81 TaxID=3344878 RepID=UPI0037DD623A